jgi:hypothetical protein
LQLEARTATAEAPKIVNKRHVYSRDDELEQQKSSVMSSLGEEVEISRVARKARPLIRLVGSGDLEGRKAATGGEGSESSEGSEGLPRS